MMLDDTKKNFIVILSILCLMTTASGTDINETRRLLNVADSLMSLSNKVNSIQIEFSNYVSASREDHEYKDRPKWEKVGRVLELGGLLNGCKLALINSSYYFQTYAEGAHWPSCAGLNLNLKELELNLDYWATTKSYDRTIIGTYLYTKSDSTRVLVKNAWLYIRESLPDSCSVN